MKSALVLGAGGFIGSHMVRRLKSEGFWVKGVDLKNPDFSSSAADEFLIGDLRDFTFVLKLIEQGDGFGQDFSQVYQFAADMGGAGYIFTGLNDSEIMHNSATINLNILQAIKKLSSTRTPPRLFYSSSACIYPSVLQEDSSKVDLPEDLAYPANPDSEYGWEKLFSERLYLTFARNEKFEVRVARYHNIFGPEGTWVGGKEKAPAAICRKVAETAPEGGEIEVWGDGNQTRSFLYIEECIDATRRLMESDVTGPINVGSEEMVSINELVEITAEIAKKAISMKHIDGPVGVRGRNSNNDMIRELLNWDYSMTLREGIEQTYQWISTQIELSSSTTNGLASRTSATT